MNKNKLVLEFDITETDAYQKSYKGKKEAS
jgi:hypothetical protein